MLEPLGEPDLRENFRCVPAPARLAAELERHEHVLDGGERRDELKVLKHESDQPVPQRRPRILPQILERLPIEPHTPAGRVVEPGAQAEQRGFSTPRRADDRARVSGEKREAHIAQNREVVPGAAICFAQIANFQNERFDTFSVGADAPACSCLLHFE